ncbi:MAG: hypothetical protein JNM84_12905 [Planctomycetes bacterium]|nr:hypothetical protein [Planctomycetota bacterium]
MNEAERAALGRKIDAGIRASIALALEEHRRAGRTVAIWRDGRVVEILPEPQEEGASGAAREEPPPERP